MKLYLEALGVVFLCLLCQQIQAVEYSLADIGQQVFEKGCRSKSKSEVTSRDSSTRGLPGLRGPRGVQGASLIPVYATAHQEEEITVSEENVNGSTVIVVPFSTIQYARGITLHADTFTFPKGVYTIRFQFVFIDRRLPDSLYLDIGGFKLELAKDWGETSEGKTFFNGSTTFQVPEDNTEIKLCVGVSSETLTFSVFSPSNYPTSIVFEKIADLA